MDLDLEGNSALVTASSSGLGKASAMALAQQGVDVVINGRDPDKLAESAAEIRKTAKGRIVEQPGDITNGDDIVTLVERAVAEFEGLDHLVTSAGGPASGPFLETTDDDWYQAFDLLVMSVVRLIREAAPHLRADDGGTFVAITSISVKEAVDSLVLSNAVRMAVIGLEKTLSKELSPKIRANAVLPGAHETSRIHNLIEQSVERGDVEDYEAGLAEWGKDIPGRGIGDPMELGEVVAFLSSPYASYINGVTLPIDGGASASSL